MRDSLNTKYCVRVSPASFWRENLIAVVILLRVLARCRSGVNKLSNIRSFIILLSGEGLTPFSINNRPSVFGEKKNEAFQGVFLWEHSQKL